VTSQERQQLSNVISELTACWTAWHLTHTSHHHHHHHQWWYYYMLHNVIQNTAKNDDTLHSCWSRASSYRYLLKEAGKCKSFSSVGSHFHTSGTAMEHKGRHGSCGWQVKLCDPLVTYGPYLTALEIKGLYIGHYINSCVYFTSTDVREHWNYCLLVHGL